MPRAVSSIGITPRLAAAAATRSTSAARSVLGSTTASARAMTPDSQSRSASCHGEPAPFTRTNFAVSEAGVRLPARLHGILEIENDGIGGRLQRFLKAIRPRGRHEQHGAEDSGRHA